MRLLLTEDDLPLGEATCNGLMQLGYAVDWLTSGARLGTAVATFDYDCVILDLGLPGQTGQQCLQAMRKARQDVPVIVITARADKSTKIELLDIGADDYLVKPFDIDELAARVRAVARRTLVPGSGGAELRHGPLLLQPATQTASVSGVPVVLTRKEFWLLETLVRQRDRIVTRRALEEALYGWDEDPSSNALEVFIYQLRRKLGSGFIKTVRGVGYRVASAAELCEEGEVGRAA